MNRLQEIREVLDRNSILAKRQILNADTPELIDRLTHCRKEMARMNLPGWSCFVCQGDGSTATAAIAHEGHILLVRDYCEVMTNDAFTLLVWHEIAHLLAPGDGHGPAWQAKAFEIGDGRVVYLDTVYDDSAKLDAVATPDTNRLNELQAEAEAALKRRRAQEEA